MDLDGDGEVSFIEFVAATIDPREVCMRFEIFLLLYLFLFYQTVLSLILYLLLSGLG